MQRTIIKNHGFPLLPNTENPLNLHAKGKKGSQESVRLRIISYLCNVIGKKMTCTQKAHKAISFVDESRHLIRNKKSGNLAERSLPCVGYIYLNIFRPRGVSLFPFRLQAVESLSTGKGMKVRAFLMILGYGERQRNFGRPACGGGR